VVKLIFIIAIYGF